MAYTTNLDGMDLGITPSTFRADPIERIAKASGIMGTVHFRWPNWTRTKLLSLSYDGLKPDQAQVLLGAFGPRTLHNKVLTVDLNLDQQMFIIPGGVDLRAVANDGLWSIDVEMHAVEYDESGGLDVHTPLATITNQPIVFAVYRYGTLLVLHQNNAYSIVWPDGSVTLGGGSSASYNTWASYNGRFVLYHSYGESGGVAPSPNPGYLQLNPTTKASNGGNDQAGMYTAPLAMVQSNSTVLPAPWDNVAEVQRISGFELNGLPYARSTANGLWIADPIARTFYTPPVNAYYEPYQHLVLFNDSDYFSYYNGGFGKLLYGQPPTTSVPYAYPLQGVLAAGFAGGYLFSPDMGISWRRRNLEGFGVVTERGILRVVPGAVYAAVGRW
jgi:hypothetical protein